MGAAFLRTVYTVFRCGHCQLYGRVYVLMCHISYGIAEKEPPLIGFYPLRVGAVPLPPASLSALFSSLTLTVPTTLPNFLVSTPTLTTPTYIFNTSVPTSVVAMSDLATSTYSPLIVGVQNGATQKLTVTSLPEVTPAPTVAVVLLTDGSGAVHTTESPLPLSTIVLGRPPGSNSASATLRLYGVKNILVTAFACILALLGAFC
jgi:hypothetical protein